MIIQLSGGSDDLIEISGDFEEEFDLGGQPAWEGELISDGQGRARVYAEVKNTGCWCLSVTLWDEGIPLPDWDFRVTFDLKVCEYSNILTMNVPAGTVIRSVTPTTPSELVVE